MVTRSSMPPLEEYIEEIKGLWDTRWLTNMGEKHRELQNLIRKYLNTDNVQLLTNGHLALELTLQSMKLEGEVITTPFTFASTTHAIVRNGLTPVFCDIDPNHYTIDVHKIEELVTDKTCAIVPVHVYGMICDVEAIDQIAKKYGLKVIYDAAHAFGEVNNGENVANYGDASVFSLHATKVYNSIEGGVVCYRDNDVGLGIAELKNFGIHSAEEVLAVGANAKMNEFCAAMGICNLRHLDEEIEKRKKVFERYCTQLSDVKGIVLKPVQEGVTSNYAYFPILINEKHFGANRDEVFDSLRKENIYARKYFFPITSEFSCYRQQYDAHETPIALDVSQRILALPMYSDLSNKDVDRICSVIRNCAM